MLAGEGAASCGRSGRSRPLSGRAPAARSVEDELAAAQAEAGRGLHPLAEVAEDVVVDVRTAPQASHKR